MRHLLGSSCAMAVDHLSYCIFVDSISAGTVNSQFLVVNQCRVMLVVYCNVRDLDGAEVIEANVV